MASPELSQPESSDEPLFDFEESYRAVDLLELRITSQILCDEIQTNIEAGEYDGNDELLIVTFRKARELLANKLGFSPESSINVTMCPADVENFIKAQVDRLPPELKLTGNLRAFGILGTNVDPQTGESTQHVPIVILEGIAKTYGEPVVFNDIMIRTTAITSLEVLE